MFISIRIRSKDTCTMKREHVEHSLMKEREQSHYVQTREQEQEQEWDQEKENEYSQNFVKDNLLSVKKYLEKSMEQFS